MSICVSCCVVYLYFSGFDTAKGGDQILAMSGDGTDPKVIATNFINRKFPQFLDVPS